MELRDYLRILRKGWTVVAATVLLCVLGAVLASALATPVYTATAQVYVSVRGGSSATDMLQGANFTRQQVASYTQIVTTPHVLGPVIDDMALDMRSDDLAARVSAGSPSNSSLIDIHATDESPAMAAALANAVADQLRVVVSELEEPTDGGPSSVKLTMVRDAAAPTAPAVPNTRLNVALALLLGLAAGCGIAVLRDVLDTRVRDEAGVARVTDTAIVGVIPDDDGATDRPLIIQQDPHAPRAEAFRRLRTNVQFLDVASTRSVFVLTSALPGEGKSTTAANLAIALADAGSRVALVEADLRKPRLATYLGLEGAAGLTTVLIGQATLEDVIQPWGNGRLHVLTSGQIPPNPSELLGSGAMSTLLDRMASQYDVVLIDTPPLLPVTDAAVLARLAGGMLLVVGAGKVQRAQLAEAIAALRVVDANLVGIIVNGEPKKPGASYGYYRQTPLDDPGVVPGATRTVAAPGKLSREPGAGIPAGAGMPMSDVITSSIERPTNPFGPVPPRHQR